VVRVTVPVTTAPPVTVAGLKATLETFTSAGEMFCELALELPVGCIAGAVAVSLPGGCGESPQPSSSEIETLRTSTRMRRFR